MEPTQRPMPAADEIAHDPRYRVAERRELREAAGIGALVGVAVLAVGLVVNGTQHAPIAVIDVLGIATLLLLFTRRARRRPHAAGFVAVVTLLWVPVVTELVDPSRSEPLLAGYLSLIIVGSALFMPWSRTWHAAWLMVAAATSLAVGVASGRSPDLLADDAILILAAVVTSAAGNAVVRRRREQGHRQQLALSAQRRELRRLGRELRVAASRDSLTGLGNRRRMAEDSADLEARLARGVLPGIAAIMVDLDHFKAYNDRAGHPAGDEILRVVAGAVRSSVREVDHVYRYGGEELLVLLEEPTREGALIAARRMLDAVRRLALPHVAQPGHVVTVSAGAASQAGPGVTVWNVIEAADRALDEAKRAGRDRVVLAPPLPPADQAVRALRQPPLDEDDTTWPDPGISQVSSTG